MKDKEFSLELLNEQLKKKSPGSIRAAFSRKIRLLGKTGQAATASTYECTINSIRRFTDTDLGFSDITPEWLKNYEKHLLAEGKSIITVKFYMGCIRSIMNVARAENKLTEAQYPFGRGKFEIKKGTGRRPALTISQISEIMKFPSLSEPEMRSRDLWLFSYFTNGINFSDMLMLRYKDIAFGEIHFFRKRTSGTASNKKEITASLLPEMREIINKWGNIDRKPYSYIFPYLNEKMDQATARKTIQNVIRLTNKRLHEISKRLNIGAVSTSSARHSYAAVLKRSGVNIAFISEALGHSDLRTTESYIASLEQEERAKNALKLTTFKSWYD